MTMLKILSAGLIATAMFTTAASARETYANQRHITERAHHAGVLPFAEPFGAYSAAPSEQPDGICDHGDNPEIC
ncbi:hypothetical protein FXV83_12360 [Bradyrhizobium hipponense]|uniref:Uncharacterized protein n=1 Tax=Bradyrhizobium hipponense TaxID=2605638 RepID=A0A5S4YQV6_9BRAD|nr:hypothetical protein [Bradyrhizobium hipponense]TYO66312.1 hypothetical protein FXV83_12360 [Bradyrhizobium hipponense]